VNRFLSVPTVAKEVGLLSYLLMAENGSAHGQAFFDRLINVSFRLHFCLSLADAARDGRTFSDIHAIFILEYGNEKLQSFSPDF